MAERTDKWEDNIGGKAVIGGKKVSFYVDRECILCSVCSDAAPNNFRMSDEEDHDICMKQPENEDGGGLIVGVGHTNSSLAATEKGTGV